MRKQNNVEIVLRTANLISKGERKEKSYSVYIRVKIIETKRGVLK